MLHGLAEETDHCHMSPPGGSSLKMAFGEGSLL